MALKRKFFRQHFIVSSYITAFTNRVIAREDDVFNRELFENAVSMSRTDLKDIPIKDTFLYKNFENLLTKEKYQFITDWGLQLKSVLELIGNIPINEKILEELKWLHDKYDYTYHHSIASTALAARLAMDYFLDEKIATEVAEASLFKDIGLGHIPEEVVNKSGRLNKKEQLVIQEHPMYSALLLAHYLGRYKCLAVEAAANHHEDMTGTGYPRGVVVNKIEIHMVKFADTFDALISARPFRNFFNLDDAFMISEAEIKLGNLDESLLPLIRSYHINFKSFFENANRKKAEAKIIT